MFLFSKKYIVSIVYGILVYIEVLFPFLGFLLSIEWPITRLSTFFTEDDCFNMVPGSARCWNFAKLFKKERDDKDAPHVTTRHNAAVWVSSLCLSVRLVCYEYNCF